MDDVVKTYPNLAAIGTAIRTILSGLSNDWQGALFRPAPSSRAAGTRTWKSKTASAAATGFARDWRTAC